MVSDRIFGLLVAAVALAYIASATQIQTSFLTDPVGPKLFPMLIGAVAFICAIGILYKPDAEPVWPGVKTMLALAISAAVLVAYAYALKPLGFIIPTAIVSTVLSYQIHSHIKSALLTGVGLSVGLFCLFKYALGLGLFAFSRNLTGS